jgi:predicted nuclease with TOPRIM domain
LPETSKQDVLLKDITNIHSQVTTLINKYRDLIQLNEKLETEVEQLRKEKADLVERISGLETEVGNIKNQPGLEIFNSLDEEERGNLKNKIDNLISRIDFHISS